MGKKTGAAVRTCSLSLDFNVLGVLTCREIRTRNELAVFAFLHNKVGAADRAFLSGLDGFDDNLFDRIHSVFDLLVERRIEFIHDIGPFFLAGFDVIEILFHSCRELYVNDLGEILIEKVGYNPA